ncbi:MAG: peroxiredoxin [Candidatus Acidiferrales bacterium]
MKRILFVALALAAATAIYAAAPPAEGAKAPDFTLNSQEGTPISLHDYQGKWVVLYFYPKDMSQGCTIEAHGFQRDLPQYDAKNAVILGVSVDTVESHQQFCAKDSLTFKLLSDTTQKVAGEYGSLMSFGKMTLAARHTFVIDPQGVIRKVYLKVNPMPHSAEVLSELSGLEKSQ